MLVDSHDSSPYGGRNDDQPRDVLPLLVMLAILAMVVVSMPLASTGHQVAARVAVATGWATAVGLTGAFWRRSVALPPERRLALTILLLFVSTVMAAVAFMVL